MLFNRFIILLEQNQASFGSDGADDGNVAGEVVLLINCKVVVFTAVLTLLHGLLCEKNLVGVHKRQVLCASTLDFA